jgi:hypothetical protein
MAIAVHAGRRHVTHRPPWVRRRTAGPDAALPLIVVMLLTVGVIGLVLSSQMIQISLPRNLVPAYHPAAPTRPVDGATPVAKPSLNAAAGSVGQAAPAAESVESPSKPAALAVDARARVANTDNMGVVFYAAPRDGTRQPAGLLEGTTVTVLERSGDEWARVQSDSKRSGWVRAQYLVPAE